MSFDTLPFALFALVTYSAWRLAASPALLAALDRALPALVLLTASIVFYRVAGLRDLTIVSGLVLVNYLLAPLVARSRAALTLAVVINIGCLAAFKYRDFLLGVEHGELLIPLGISFYVFQMTAYQVDVWRGHCLPERRLGHFALFVGFFPQLIAGPIVRARQFLPQIRAAFAGRGRRLSAPVVGLALICLGLLKKVVLADSLAPHVDAVFTLGPADLLTAWLGAWLFAFQIYFDFSGYSDMAVGLGRLLGFRLPVNFRQPYLSRSPQEFWRRWHITLSNWIRDYLYIPLGGRRRGGAARQAAVLLLVMGLAGLWHGASWNFVVWGLAWGAFIAAWRPLARVLASNPLAGWSLTLLGVVVLWVLFRAPDADSALAYLATLSGAEATGTHAFDTTPVLLLAGAVALIGLHGLERLAFGRRVRRLLLRSDGPFAWGLLLGLALWLVTLPRSGLNPFIYFRF